jgi:hypothetical protein
MLDAPLRRAYLGPVPWNPCEAVARAARPASLHIRFAMSGSGVMWETCAVELRVQLPRAVAAEVREVQQRDPEALSRILLYGLTRRAIFEHLARDGNVEDG